MAATAPRSWEDNKNASPAAPRESLPSIAALTSNLPNGNSAPSPTSTRERDSGAWSSRPESTRSSTYSLGTSAYQSSATNSYYMSPNRASQLSSASGYGSGAHASADYSVERSSAGPLSSPPAEGQRNPLPSLNSVHEPLREEAERYQGRESRRGSIGSQLNQSVHQLHLNGFNSPYSASVNHSQTSLTASLNQQRGIPSHTLRTSQSSAQLHRSPPTSHTLNDGRPGTSARQAPPIGSIPRREIVNGQEPIKGQAYAFPDAEGMEPGNLPPNRALSSRGSGHSTEHVPLGSLMRRGSGHTSLASSVMTTGSHLPAGQHRLDDDMSAHHHSIRDSQMSSQMSDVMEDDALTPEGDSHTPYSRTPALRVSHKMAERKRRSEMKDLFENLRSQIPSSQGSKSSKWEILSKASDYITQLERQASSGGMTEQRLRSMNADFQQTRDREHFLAQENVRLQQELAMLRQQSGQNGAPAGPAPQQPHQAHPHHLQPGPPAGHQAPPPPSAYAGVPQSYVPPPAPAPLLDSNRSLPPLAPPPAVGSGMEGIRYSH